MLLSESLSDDLKRLDGSPVPGSYLERFRAEHDLSQSDLADLLCTKQPQISLVESGERQLQGSSAKLFRILFRYYDVGGQP